MKIKNLKLTPIICSFVFFGLTTAGVASDNSSIPVPPKRPDILNVSPAYIKQLTNRNTNDDNDFNNIDPASGSGMGAMPPAITPPENLSLDNHSIKRINANELVEILEDVTNSKTAKSTQRGHIPVPSRKPKNISENIPQDTAETLISFSLQPEQMHLDDVIKDFLSNKAINLFEENQGVKLDIQAYAEMEDNKPNSDTRISLARALQVRQFLMQKGISPSRLKLSAMGQDSETNSHNRIDLIFKDTQ